MRKIFVCVLVLIAVLCAGIACADDGEKMKFDNVTFGKSYKINGYAVVTFIESSFIDAMGGYGTSNIYSGNEADMLYLRMDIRNLSKKDTKFLGSIGVRVVYDDEYEYNGFARQYNYDKSNDQVTGDDIPVGPMYTGHFALLCTLPNFIVQDKSSPLRMIITINGHEFIYNIRK